MTTMQPARQLSPERLFAAAEASLRAASETSDKAAAPYPLDMLGRPDMPECLAPFSRWEIQEACKFLVRLGVLEFPTKK